MTDEQLRALYEKLYFQEIETREKIQARLQLPLTLIVALLGGILFLVGRIELSEGDWSLARIAFVFSLVATVIVLMVAAVNFARALHNNAYYFLADARATRDYRQQCEETYRQYSDAAALVQQAMGDYIVNAYIEYGSYNTRVNDRRSGFIHNCNGAIVVTAGLLFATFVIFNAAGLDKNKMNGSATQIHVYQLNT